jgi:hypothetical protein
MEYSIESRTLTQQPAAVRQAMLSAGQVGSWLATATLGLRPTWSGPGADERAPYARYLFRDREMEVEAGIPITRPIAGEGPIVPSTLPGGPTAVTAHYGRYEDLENAHKAIMTWMQRHGCEPAGGHWEVYFTARPRSRTAPAGAPTSSRRTPGRSPDGPSAGHHPQPE